MKFGKMLQMSKQDLPEMEPLFLRYKELKKQLKAMSPELAKGENGALDAADSDAATELARRSSSLASEQSNQVGQASQPTITSAERTFITTLNEDLAKFNDFFIEREEDFIITTKELEDACEQAQTPDDVAALQTKFTDLHGEMVLVLHWSLLNYAALMKILKKHDKQTGRPPIRNSYLSTVLQQPFYSTDGITKLVKRVEDRLAHLARRPGASEKRQEPSRTAEELTVDTGSNDSSEPLMLRRAEAALGMWQELGMKASTPSTVAPPPKKRQKLAAGGQLAEVHG